MLIEAIIGYLGSIGGPDRESWRLWLAVTVGGLAICGMLAYFHVG